MVLYTKSKQMSMKHRSLGFWGYENHHSFVDGTSLHLLIELRIVKVFRPSLF